MTRQVLTIGELKRALEPFDNDLPVRAICDTISDWAINRVELLCGVVLLDVGDGDGDFIDAVDCRIREGDPRVTSEQRAEHDAEYTR